MTTFSKPGEGPELVIERTFNAPRELVFRMWTEKEHMDQWGCPTGFTIPYSEGEIREGGWFRTCMRSPDGEDHWLAGRYLEIKPPERLAFTHGWQNDEGHTEHETVVTVTLDALPDGMTRLVLHQAYFPSDASRDGHRGGWIETLDKLERYLTT